MSLLGKTAHHLEYSVKRTKQAHVYLSDAERQELQRRADAIGVKVSDYIRMKTLYNTPHRTTLFEKDLNVLSTAMKQKIDRDTHKGSWTVTPIVDLLYLLKLEVAELENAIYNESNKAQIKECADIANFCMMIAGNVKRLALDNSTN